MALAEFEQQWARELGRAMVPPGVLGGVVDDVDLGARFAEEYALSPWYAGMLMRLSLWLTWFAPIWRRFRPRTFRGLDAAAQVALLEDLLVHPNYNIRLVAMFLKLSVCTQLLGDERALAKLGAYRLDEKAAERSAS